MAALAQVDVAKKENRHELVLSGPDISKQIESNGLHNAIYTLSSLNFLEISKTCLESLSEDLGKLSSLTSLILHNNHLTELPKSIGKLTKLKTLDISNNRLCNVPDEIGLLCEVQSLNASCNKLDGFPNMENLVQLHIFDISHNSLETLPEGICHEELTLLAQIIANGNVLTELPDELCDLPALKVLNVADNALKEIPVELCDAPKLKQFVFTGNKIADRRLAKMANDCQTRAVLEYLRKSASKKQKQDKDKVSKEKQKSKDKSRKERKRAKKVQEEADALVNFMRVLHFHDGLTVQATDTVGTVRPYLVCCIVRNIDFHKTNNMYKRFITLQTKLHDTVCESRQAGTIATHDLAKVKAPLSYDARDPTQIMVTPLFKSKAVSAEQLVSKLRQEAEEYRKEKKRNTISGIHKYLDLLKGKAVYPCLVDRDGIVISFPPITNCDATKISADTKELLIEVTSTVTLDKCKAIMHTLLTDMLEMGLGNDVSSRDDESDEEDGATGGASAAHALTVEQVQVLDSEGQMKVVYPSRVDLASDTFKVIRDN